MIFNSCSWLVFHAQWHYLGDFLMLTSGQGERGEAVTLVILMYPLVVGLILGYIVGRG